MKFDPRAFKPNDVRGIWPDQIGPGFGYGFGRALARVLCSRRVAVGRDARLSSPQLAAELCAGLQAEGAQVEYLGLCPSELIYYLLGIRDDLDVGVMVTASHNPGSFNGLKIVRQGAVPVTARDGLEQVREWMEDAREAHTPACVEPCADATALEDYFQFGARVAGVPKCAGLKVIIDAGNGTAGLLWGGLTQITGVTPLGMNLEPDGRFPAHPPDPSRPAHLASLIERVQTERADLGLAYDGDADRTVAVLPGGHILDGSETMACLAERLRTGSGLGNFAASMMTSRRVLDYFRARSMEPQIVPVGHAKVKRLMRADPSIEFAGEQSGHYFYREFFCCESALITTLLLMELAAEGRLERLVRELPGPWHGPQKEPSYPFECPELATEACRRVARRGIELFGRPAEIMCEEDWRVERHCPVRAIDRADGIRVDYPEWWFCVRPSATEPLARLWVESRGSADREAKEAALARLFPAAEG